MAQTGVATQKWVSVLGWTQGDFEQAKKAAKALESKDVVAWTHPPTQPECKWMVLLASETLTYEQLKEVMRAKEREFELWWEGAYYSPTLSEVPYRPHECENCGGPTHYSYRHMEFAHPTDATSFVHVPEDENYDGVLVKLENYSKKVFLCFNCLEGYIGDNEMTLGGTGIWMGF